MGKWGICSHVSCAPLTRHHVALSLIWTWNQAPSECSFHYIIRQNRIWLQWFKTLLHLFYDQAKQKVNWSDADVTFCSGTKASAALFMSPPSSLWKADEAGSLLMQVPVLLSTLPTLSKSELLLATTRTSSSDSPSLLLSCSALLAAQLARQIAAHSARASLDYWPWWQLWAPGPFWLGGVWFPLWSQSEPVGPYSWCTSFAPPNITWVSHLFILLPATTLSQMGRFSNKQVAVLILRTSL